VPGYPVGGGVELPVKCQDGNALTAYFAADPVAADELLRGTGLGPAVRVAGRALVAVHAAWNRRTGVGGYREAHLGVVVPDPWRPGSLRVWPDLLRGAGRRRSGSFLAGSVVDAEPVHALAERLWGGPALLGTLRVEVTSRAARVTARDGGEMLFDLCGLLGPALPAADPDLVGYARRAGVTVRSALFTRGAGRAHPAPLMRLSVGDSAHPPARHLRDLGLDGARPLLCLSCTARQTLRGAGVAVLTT
jgi:hypothetical protein